MNFKEKINRVLDCFKIIIDKIGFLASLICIIVFVVLYSLNTKSPWTDKMCTGDVKYLEYRSFAI